MRIKDILKKKVLLALSAGILSFSFVNLSYAMPVQDATKQFDATTSVAGNVMDIAGVKTNNVLNWKSFDIAKGETVSFDAGDQTKNYLNLIHDVKASEIFGNITGGNNVYLINPNGVLFGAGSSVNVGNLHVSTRALSEVDVDNFSSTGANPLSTAASSVTGDITNMGNLVANKVVLEGNNILLQNSAALQNGSAQLTGEDVVLKAKGDIDVGQESDKSAVTEVNDIQFSAEDKAVYKSTADDLKWTTTDLEGNSKTATDYKLIHNVYELQNMKNSKQYNEESEYDEYVGNFMLANDIEAGETNPENEIFDINGYWQDEKGFLPIGDGVDVLPGRSQGAFVGKFHGAKHTINNLYINRPAQDFVGLFGYTYGATVKDVGMVDSKIIGKNYVGSLVGSASNSTIRGYNTGYISGTNYVGGLVGDAYSDSKVTGYNTGDVSGTYYVGGLVGYTEKSTITGYNTGNINGYTSVGGLVGVTKDTTVMGYNIGKVTARRDVVGGLVGGNQSGPTSTSIIGYNTGDVSGSGMQFLIGGLVGSRASASITGFYDCNIKIDGVDERKFANSNMESIIDSQSAMQISSYENISVWDISNIGGAGKTWRLYEDCAYPLLNKANGFEFLQPLDLSNVEKSQQVYNGEKQTMDSVAVFGDEHILSTETASKNVGTYNVKLYSDQQGYDIIGNLKTVELEITPKEIFILASDDTKPYDKKDYVGEVTVIDGKEEKFDLFAGDKFETLNASSEGLNAGKHDIKVNYKIDDGNDGKNYDVQTTDAKLTINPATLILRAENYNKAYDGTAATENKYIATGLADGDELSVVTKFSGKDVQDTALSIFVDSYVLNDGNDGNNYNVIKLTGSGVIYKADVILTADPATSIMGQPIEKVSGKASGFAAGEGLEKDLLTWTTDVTPRSMVGNYAINGSINDAYLATYSRNYNIKQAESNATAYSITSNEQEKIAGYMVQEADYVLAVNPAALYSVRAETLRDVLGYPELVRRKGVGLSEESMRNLIIARL